MTEKSSSTAFHGIIRRGQPGSGLALTRPRSFTSGAKRRVGATSQHFLKHILRHKRTAQKREDTYRQTLANPVYHRLYQQVAKRYEPILPATQSAPKAAKSSWQPMDYVLPGGETSASARTTQMFPSSTSGSSSTVQSFSAGMAIPRMEDDPTAVKPKTSERFSEKAPEKRPQKPVVPPTHRLFSRVTEVTSKEKEPSPAGEPELDIPEPPRPVVSSSPKRESPHPAAHPMTSQAHEPDGGPAFDPPSGPPASAKPADIPIHQARRVHAPARAKPETPAQSLPETRPETQPKPATPPQEVSKPAAPAVQPGTIQREMQPLVKPVVSHGPKENIPAALPAKPKVNRPVVAPTAKPARRSAAPVIQAKRDDQPAPSAPHAGKPDTSQAPVPSPISAGEKSPALPSAAKPLISTEKTPPARMTAHPAAPHVEADAPAEPSAKLAQPLAQPHTETIEPAIKPGVEAEKVSRSVKPAESAHPDPQLKPLVKASQPAPQPAPIPVEKASPKAGTSKPIAPVARIAPVQPGQVEHLAPRPEPGTPELSAKPAPTVTPVTSPGVEPELKLTLRSRPRSIGVMKSSAVKKVQPSRLETSKPGAGISGQVESTKSAAAPVPISKQPDAGENAPRPTLPRRAIRTFTQTPRVKSIQAPQPKPELPVRALAEKSEPSSPPVPPVQAVPARPAVGAVRFPVIQRTHDATKPSRLQVRTRSTGKPAQAQANPSMPEVEKPVWKGMKASVPTASAPSARSIPFTAPSEAANAPAKMTFLKQKTLPVSAAPEQKSKPAPSAPKKKENLRPQPAHSKPSEPAREKIAMPVVSTSQPGVIQRMPAETSAQPPVQDVEPQENVGKPEQKDEKKKTLDLDTIAQQIYPILLRKISIERERSSRWH